jgi:hypothetical protein
MLRRRPLSTVDGTTLTKVRIGLEPVQPTFVATPTTIRPSPDRKPQTKIGVPLELFSSLNVRTRPDRAANPRVGFFAAYGKRLQMLIKYGFDIEVRLWQPTTLITTMDVHASRRDAVAWESIFELSDAALLETFFDDEDNKIRRLTAGPGVVGMKLTGVVNDSGALDDCDPSAELVPGEGSGRGTRCLFFERAAIARPTFSPISPGVRSDQLRAAMRACRPSVTTFIVACASVTQKRVRPARLRTP